MAFIYKRKLVKILIIAPILYFVYFLFVFSSINEDINTNDLQYKALKPTVVAVDKNNNNNNEDDNVDENYNLIKDNGKLGKALRIEKDKLDSVNKKLFDDGWDKNAFNLYASDRIPINRTLPDVRLAG